MKILSGGTILKGTLRKFFFVLFVFWVAFLPFSVPLYFSNPNLAIGLVFVITPFGALIVTLVSSIQARWDKEN
jgi:hypothetical protein